MWPIRGLSRSFNGFCLEPTSPQDAFFERRWVWSGKKRVVAILYLQNIECIRIARISPASALLFKSEEIMGREQKTKKGNRQLLHAKCKRDFCSRKSPFENFIRKVWGQDRRICSLILGVKGLKSLKGVHWAIRSQFLEKIGIRLKT